MAEIYLTVIQVPMYRRSQPTRRSSLARNRILISSLITLMALTAPAIAADISWNTNSGTWSEDFHWTPDGKPGSSDVAQIGDLPAANGASVSLDEDAEIAGLRLSSGATLNSGGYRLNVSGDVTATGTDTKLNLANSPAEYDFAANNVQLDKAVLNLGNAKSKVSGVLSLAHPGFAEVAGAGEIHFSGTGTTLINDGRLSASGVTQTYKQLSTGLFDLGGSGSNSQIGVHNGGTMVFEGQGLTDAFSGVLFLEASSKLVMNLNSGWESSFLTMVSNPHNVNAPARIEGSDFTTSSIVYAEANSALEFDVNVHGAMGASLVLGQNSTVDFLQNVRWDSDESSFVFESGSNSRFHRKAEISQPVLNGGHFEVMPTGQMIIPNDSIMHGVTIENHGLFEIGEGTIGEALLGDFNNEADGTFRFDIMATASGVEQDFLNVHDYIQLDGSIDVVLSGSGPHLPQIGDSFLVMFASYGLSGTFDNTPMSHLDGLYYFWNWKYGPNTASLVLAHISPVPEPSSIVLAVFATGAMLPFLRAHHRRVRLRRSSAARCH